jgi:L-ascorbate metabolism protein UlaG (beta-lactamase superfamily)
MTGSAILTELQSQAAVCWLGNLGWLLHAGGQLVAFDLDLERSSRLRPSPLSAHDIAPVLHVHFVTHEHEDHFASPTSEVLARESECLFVVPANCADKARRIGVPEERLRVAVPGMPFDLPGLWVEPLRALHGHRQRMVYRHANMDDCGYKLTLGGLTFLQPGDTLLLDEHMDHAGVDVLFVSPTEHNMLVDHAAMLINALQPRFVFPQHFDTYVPDEQNSFWTIGYPDELRAALPPPLRERYHRLTQGEAFALA